MHLAPCSSANGRAAREAGRPRVALTEAGDPLVECNDGAYRPPEVAGVGPSHAAELRDQVFFYSGEAVGKRSAVVAAARRLRAAHEAALALLKRSYEGPECDAALDEQQAAYRALTDALDRLPAPAAGASS